MNPTPHELRLEGLARRHGMGHAIVLGETLANMLLIASGALASVGQLLGTAVARRAPKGPASQG